jgi:heat shock protein HspQ
MMQHNSALSPDLAHSTHVYAVCSCTCSQPFYHLLVEVSDWSYDAAQPPVAYVAQELLAAPELEDEGASWGQVRLWMDSINKNSLE